MQNYLAPNFSLALMAPGRALGSYVWGTEGCEYIDLSDGIAVNALGHCHPDLITALAEQSQKLQYISNTYTVESAQELAQKLIEHTFADKVLFCSSGAGANEAALELARKYGRDHFGGHKTRIISCLNSFHDRTPSTVSVSGQSKYGKSCASLPPGITHVPFNDIAALEATISKNTYAVIIESIQGESGILPATQKYLQAACRLCDEHGALLILDEVQADMGHTGKLFAYEHYGITPDILSSTEALGGGLPISTILTTGKVAPAFGPRTRGSTLSDSPMVCVVGNRASDIIGAPETLAYVEKQGQKLQAALQELDEKTGTFKEVRGMGLLIGCVLTDKYQSRASEITAAALKHGPMILAAGVSVMRFAPSLLLNDKGVEEDLKRLEAALKGWAGQDV